MKKLLALLLLVPSLALSAVTATVTPGDWPLYRGSTIVSRHASLEACVEAAKALNVARSYTCRTSTGVVVKITADPPPPPPSCAAPQPAAETQTVQCPAGTTGSWQQTRTYSAAVYPTCWTAGAWSPTAAPAGACVTPPPPPPAGDLYALYSIERPQGQGTGPSVYVATTGSDTAAGTEAAPLKTLPEAITRVKPGGTIIMRAGTYQGAVVNAGYGTATQWVTLKAAPGEQVILQGNARGTWAPTLYFYQSSCDEYAPAGSICASSYWVVDGLTIRGYNGGGGDSNAVKIDTQHVQVINSVLCCAGPDVVKIVRTANDAALVKNEIFGDASVVTPFDNSQGVDITGADRVRVVGNYLHDLPDIALYGKGNAREAIFAANRIFNAGYSDRDNFAGIMMGQQTDSNRLVDGPYEAYDGLVVNNIIEKSSGACIAASSSLNSHFYHNTCIGTAYRGSAAILVSTEGGYDYTPNKGADFRNNLIVNVPDSPRMIRSTDREYTRPTEPPLTITSNVYWAGGTAPTFTWVPDFYDRYPFDRWVSAYLARYGVQDTSTIADPQLDGYTPRAPVQGVPNLAPVDFNGKVRTRWTIGAIE